jgi:hypothetical protein
MTPHQIWKNFGVGVQGVGVQAKKQILRSPPPNSAPKSTNHFLGTPRTAFGAPFAQNDTANWEILSEWKLAAHFAHDAEDVVCGVFEGCHPQIMVGHSGDQVWFFEERGATGLDCSAGGVDVVHFVIKDGTAARFRFLWSGEHEADVAALEEGEVAGVEEELHAKGVLVEILGAGEVIDSDGDLTDRIEMDSGGCGIGMAHRVPPVR